jgi:hypothetical protein
MRSRLIPILALFLASLTAQAADKADVLNFEGDVIEGEKKVPELFLQTDVQRLSLESVLYQRKNFNDFHSVDSKQRPRLSDPPKRDQRRR